MTLTFFNTLTRKKDDFVPRDPSHVGVYLCGPTVYDFAHIGNARNVVLFDVLCRLLRLAYPKVTYVRNITDVDDKINKAAAQNKESIDQLTARTEKAYNDDMTALHTLPPDLTPRATHHIPHMIAMIEGLIQKGHAYEAHNHVLFNVASFESYGQLSGRNLDEMIAGARVEVAPYKKNPADFVLWKPSDDQTPGWESPWGRGRPGWHIECSAMSWHYLGETFDIHGGGQDLIFPHHENERAQSCCFHGTSSFADYWIHNGHLTVRGEKMSKSLGNFVTVRDLLTQHQGEVIRLGLMSTHYRQPLDWTDQTTHQAKQNLDKFYGVLWRLNDNQPQESSSGHGAIAADSRVQRALEDDLNIPLALTHLHDLATQFHQEQNSDKQQEIGQRLKASGTLLGLFNHPPQDWFQKSSGGAGAGDWDVSHIETLITQRQEARRTKNFSESDRLRDLLLLQGIKIEDGPDGPIWRRL